MHDGTQKEAFKMEVEERFTMQEVSSFFNRSMYIGTALLHFNIYIIILTMINQLQNIM